MSWYFYVRMSHKTSAESGLSEIAQLRAIESYYSAVSVNANKGKDKFPSDASPGNFIDRGVSGWSKPLDMRPAGSELLRTVKRGDHIVFYNVERAFRNTEECLRTFRILSESGVSCHFACEQFDFTTASGKLMGTVMAAIAAYQSDLQSERIREAKAIKRLTGKAGGTKKRRDQWGESEFKVLLHRDKEAEPSGTVRIYNRVSSLDQTISGLSMEHQRTANINKAKRLQEMNPSLSGETVTYEDESVSAYKIPFHNRPGASKMLADLNPGDHIVIYRADRAFRNTRQSCEFVEHCGSIGVTVHLTRDGVSSGDEFGRMFFQMLSMFAEIESSIKSRRKHEINEYLSSHGRPISTTPIQYKGVKVNGKKILKHDFSRLQEMSHCWMIRKLGYSYEATSQIMYAYRCMDRGEKPKLRGGSFNVERRNADRFDEIIDSLPRDLVSDLLAASARFLSREIDRKYTVWCKTPLPLDCTADHLADHGISQELLANLPNHSRLASAQA